MTNKENSQFIVKQSTEGENATALAICNLFFFSSMHFDRIVMMRKMKKKIDDDDHDENVVVEILVLVNELLQAMIFSSHDYSMNDKKKTMMTMKMKIDDVDEVLKID